jgi:large repetitive protein
LIKESAANYDEPSQQIDVVNNDGFLPDSNLDEDFKVQISIEDEAGNTWKSQLQTFRYDNYVGAPKEPIGVYEPNSSNNSLGPGLDGFVEYKSGMEVKTNPIRLAYRVEKNNWHEYSPGGISLINSLGEAKVVGTDNNYVYISWSAPYGNTNPNSTRWANFGSWSGGGIYYNLRLSSSAPKTPTLEGVEYHYSDIGWGTFTRYEIMNDKLPVSFDKIRVNAEARTFDQIATHRGTCLIPAGETSCTIDSGYTMEPGTTGYIHDRAAVTSENGELSASSMYAEVHWNDLHYPSLTYDYSEMDKKIKVFITQPSRGSYFDRLRLRSAWIENESGQKLTVSGGLVEENGKKLYIRVGLKNSIRR